MAVCMGNNMQQGVTVLCKTLGTFGSFRGKPFKLFMNDLHVSDLNQFF